MTAPRGKLGPLIRALRLRRNWTLRQMGERCGISASSLSKVENDKLSLTYDKIVDLAQKLGIGIAEFFAEEDEVQDTPVTGRRSIVADAASGFQVRTANYDYRYLCTDLRHKRMIPILTHIRARTLADFGALVRHSGEEYLYVLTGAVTVHTEFYLPVTLDAGQSIYLDSTMAHAYTATGCEEAVALCLCSSPDERLHDELVDTHHPDTVITPSLGPSQGRRADQK
ncbi:XRE family transcriptional regulator [Nitrospirillum sp. BR 11163]|uniref:helix-turn-helix domain-containing protein n=1 Tax=Nitrospirillum sp. BR 11163 TaxID=3104323 RepID=UPI002AFE4E81|nr:XRE family transcriptional regulator [Nitrospirillum sp. BR 11163]MEA1672721.1 XRE family transcriptional regulator [Nitrospirillum sp. BR 11163]